MMTTNDLLNLIGKFHIVSVHFPIALVVLAGLIEFWEILKRKSEVSRKVFFFLNLSLLSSILAVTLGWIHSWYVEFHGSALDTFFFHKWLSLVFLAILFLCYICALVKYKKYYTFERFFKYYRPLLFLSLILLAITSHFGGSLVYGSNYFFESFEENAVNASINIDSKDKKISYSKNVHPIFQNSCYKCHGNGKKKGGFNLDSRENILKGGKSGKAVIVGDSKNSYLIKLVKAIDPENVMPEKGRRLTSDEIETLSSWIDQGVPWEDKDKLKENEKEKSSTYLTTLSLSSIEIPNNVKSGLNFLLKKYFEKHKLPEPEFLENRLLVKKTYIDILGRFPTYKEVLNLEKDFSPENFKFLIDKLLRQNTNYSVNWLPFWNDLLRNDYSGPGFLKGGRSEITDWLFKSLLENKSYKEMTKELIAPNKKSNGFIKGLVWQGKANPNELPPMQAAQNTAQVFMGVNLKCASCHDSFIDDWKLKDAYGLANVFAKEPLETHRCADPKGEFEDPKFIFPELGEIKLEKKKSKTLENLANLFTKEENGRFSRTIVNRIWQKLIGRGLIYDVDSLHNVPWSSEILDYLANFFIKNNYDLKILIKEILLSNAYKYKAFPYKNLSDDKFIFKGPAIRKLSFEQYIDIIEQFSSNWVKLTANDVTRAERLLKNKKRASNLDVQITPENETSVSFKVPKTKKLLLVVTRRKKLGKFPVELVINNFALKNRNGDVLRLKDLKVNKHHSQVIHPKENLIDVSKLPEVFAKEELRMYPFTAIELELPKDAEYELSMKITSKEMPLGLERYVSKKDKGKKRKNIARFMILTDVDIPVAFREMNDLYLSLGRPERAQVTTKRNENPNTMKALRLQTSEFINSLFDKNLPEAKTCDMTIKVKELYKKLLLRMPSANEEKLANELYSDLGDCRKAYKDLIWIIINLPEFQLLI